MFALALALPCFELRDVQAFLDHFLCSEPLSLCLLFSLSVLCPLLCCALPQLKLWISLLYTLCQANTVSRNRFQLCLAMLCIACANFDLLSLLCLALPHDALPAVLQLWTFLACVRTKSMIRDTGLRSLLNGCYCSGDFGSRSGSLSQALLCWALHCFPLLCFA